MGARKHCAIIRYITKLLTKVLREVEELPEERQDDVAHVIQVMLSNDAHDYEMTDAQLRDVDAAIADTKAGTFASDTEIAEALHRPWT
jgi:hypothetical protein